MKLTRLICRLELQRWDISRETPPSSDVSVTSDRAGKVMSLGQWCGLTK